jgi:membrane-associated phospholipid phosphatase
VTNTFIHRYDLDRSRPSVGSALRDAALRVLVPTVVLFAAIVGIGLLITGPLGDLKSENSISKSLADGRTSLWNSITAVWSHIGNTEIVIGVCLIAVAVIWWRTKEWWYAVVPLLAIAAQASAFVGATAVVGRQRPTVPHLDPAPPTSSYPSGHMGASTALYLTFAVMAQRIENVVLRRIVTIVCVIVPFLVGFARLYRGMHHLSDVIVGALNGIVCMLLAWHYLRRDTTRGRVKDAARATVGR